MFIFSVPLIGKIVLTVFFGIMLFCGVMGLIVSISTKDQYPQNGSTYRRTYYNQSKSLSPDPFKIYETGLSYAKSGALEIALGKFKQVLEILGASFSASQNIRMLKRDACYNCGLANEKLGNYNKAIEYYKKSTQVDPNFYKAFCNIGSVFVRMNDYDRGLDFLNSALEMNPTDYIAYFNRAIVNNYFGKEKSVLQDLEKFVNYAPPYDPYINEAQKIIREIKSKNFDAEDIGNRLRSIM